MCDQHGNDDGMATVRTTVVLLASAFVALIAGALAYMVEPSVPGAVLTGGIAFGAGVWWWHRFIRRSKDD